ncbi:hemoglobin subunit alpha-D-like [Entelurus aequoreus]|uniref:hemoglobin subunit alpha-D-like n=1 Tax=Entelurus aequoreus TaxID=161455 RepID=UPI002B1DB70C|nr:hemoglobin subunit alpha-D-like [Entelurus aequoreus]
MLSQKEKELLATAWRGLTPAAGYLGSDALIRMFTTFPGSKTYFSHLDISPGSAHLFSHGEKIVLAIAEGAQDISQLTVTLAPLQTLHAYLLRIDPSNFKLLSHCILVALAIHMGEDFTPVLHAVMDKYLSAFAAVLAEKYR